MMKEKKIPHLEGLWMIQHIGIRAGEISEGYWWDQEVTEKPEGTLMLEVVSSGCSSFG